MKIVRVHDRFVRFAMSLPDVAVAFLKKFIDEEHRRQLDLDHLTLSKDTFVDQKLAESLTDMLFSVPYRGMDACIQILMEHKSQGAARAAKCNLPFQLRFQEVKIMNSFWQHSGHFPRVFLLGFHHGNKQYTGPLSVGEKMLCPEWDIPLRWKEKINLVDLACFEDDALRDSGKLGIFLLVLKHIYDPNVVQIMSGLAAQMREVEKEDNGADFLVSVFTYLYQVASMDNREQIEKIALESFTEETGGRIMTIAEKLLKEGMEKGLKEGMEKGRKEGMEKGCETVALNMLKEGADLAFILKVSQLSPEQLQRLREENS